MVVVVVVGILSTTTMLSINANSAGKTHKTEAQRAYILLRLAADEALMSLDVIGVHFSTDGYGFYKRSSDDEGNISWEAFDAGGRLRERELAKGISLDLELEAQLAVLTTREEQSEDSDEPLTPHLWLLPDGEVMPQYKLSVLRENADAAWQILPDDEGPLSLERIEL